MKKQKKEGKKLSLNKLQIAKITTSMNSIRGGDGINTGNDTVHDKTKTTIEVTVGA